MANREAQIAFNRAEFAKNQSEISRTDLQILIESIQEFLDQQGAKPEHIRDVSVVCLYRGFFVQ